LVLWVIIGTTKGEAPTHTSETIVHGSAATPKTPPLEHLIKRERDTICLPEDHTFFRLRIPFHEYLEKGKEVLSLISDALGKFGTETDPIDLQARRTCDAAQMTSGMCRLAGVTALTTEEDIAAFDTLGIRTIELLAKATELEFQFREQDIHSQKDEVLTLKWNSLNTLVRWNLNAKDSGNVGVPTYDGNSKSFRMPLYPTFRPSIWENLITNLPKSNDKKQIVFTADNLKKFWATLASILDKANELIKNYEVLVQQISVNRFPIKTLNLYTDLALINVSLTNMPPNFNAQSMIPDILQMPFTIAKLVKGWCGARSLSKVESEKMICFLDVITVVPIIATNKKYKVYSLSTLPQVDQTYVLQKLKWKSVQIPAKLLVQSQHQSFFSNQSNLDCHGIIPEAQCNLCYAYDAFESEGNRCLEDISEGLTTLTNCPEEKIDNPTNTLTQLTDDTYAYVDNTPGSLEEICPDGTRTIALGYSGVMTLLNNCRYKLIDGPINSRIGLPPSINMEIIPRQRNPLKDLPGNTLLNDLNSVQIHFRNYGYIYVIVMAGTLLIMAAIIGFFCRLRCRYRAAKNRITRKSKQARVARRMGSEIETQLDEMIPPTVKPLPPKWPSINFLPNAISIRPT
jgi:hypothetical protein